MTHIDIPISDTEQEFYCLISFDLDGGDGSGGMTLSYAVEKGEWVLQGYSDESIVPPLDYGRETIEDVVNDYGNTADEVANAFAAIQTEIDMDTSMFDSWLNRDETTYPESVNGVSTLDDIADIYKFTLDGKTYALPCDLQDLLDDGWTTRLIDPSTDTMSARTYSSMILYKGDSMVSFCIANFEETEITVSQSKVIKIEVSSNDNVAFQTGKGLKIGDDFTRVTELYGSETYGSYDDGVEYCYLRQLGMQENIIGIMKEYTLEDYFKVQWDSSGKIDYIEMKFLNE